MVTVKVRLQSTAEPATRVSVALAADVGRAKTKPVLTDPLGEVRFACALSTGLSTIR